MRPTQLFRNHPVKLHRLGRNTWGPEASWYLFLVGSELLAAISTRTPKTLVLDSPRQPPR